MDSITRTGKKCMITWPNTRYITVLIVFDLGHADYLSLLVKLATKMNINPIKNLHIPATCIAMLYLLNLVLYLAFITFNI